MQNVFISSLRGYVKIQVKGGNIEQLLNMLVAKHLLPWNIAIRGDKQAVMNILVADFFRLRPILKQTGCRVHVLERKGFPFVFEKWVKRKFFAAGMICFVLFVYILSSFVWEVKVEGNEQLTKDQILQAARQQGIYPMQWKFRLNSPETLSRGLQSTLPGTAWVGVAIQGTQIHIKVVESRNPADKPLMSPRHLVARKNAMVTQIFTEIGKPLVEPNTYVRQGDILISGIIGSDANQKIVTAKGKVKGLVWYTAKIEVPLVQYSKVYTGEMNTRSYLMLGNRGLQLTGYGKAEYEQFESVIERKQWQWGRFTIPLGWLTEKIMATKLEPQQIEYETAKSMGLEQAKKDILIAAGEDSRVTEQKVLHEKAENGKVYMEAHFEVEEYIMQELPIIQNQGE